MLKSWVCIFTIFMLLLLKMAPSPPMPPSSLPHRHRTSVRNVRQNAMLPPYAVPRVLPNHWRPPFQDIGNRIQPTLPVPHSETRIGSSNWPFKKPQVDTDTVHLPLMLFSNPPAFRHLS
ncbi:hypothetical protein K438DRAFT_2017776 [Mycena galopus ATCC 62051]|nr:hypothetical protein K438DRAFT_2017776 [Mycena galopus ATCC 62051]